MFDHVPFWWVVASREITTVVRRRSFQLSVAFIVIGIIGGAFLSTFVGNRAVHYEVAAVGAVSVNQIELAAAELSERMPGSTVSTQRVDSRAEAEKLVGSGAVDAALVEAGDGPELIGNHDVPLVLRATLMSVVADETLKRNAAEAGVDVDDITRGSELKTQLITPGAEVSFGRTILGFSMAMLFYGTSAMFGITIAQSVVGERENRVVEILAAAVPLRSLLWGKVVGNTLLALGQMALAVGVGLLALRLTRAEEMMTAAWGASGWFLVFFLLGFVALSGLWAIAGAIASRQEDLQSTTMPANLLLLVPFIIAIAGGAQLKAIVSMIPVASAIVMPVRLASAPVPEWQLWVSVAANVAAIILTVWLAAKVYERTLMRPGRRLRWRDALATDA